MFEDLGGGEVLMIHFFKYPPLFLDNSDKVSVEGEYVRLKFKVGSVILRISEIEGALTMSKERLKDWRLKNE